MKKHFLTFLLTFLLILSGCSTKESEHLSHNSVHTNGDQIEETKGITQLPSFLKNVDSSIQKVYQLAVENDQIIANMACYCGCGDSVGHKSNRDCFIREKKADGSIIWNSHAITCQNCQEIAAESIYLKKNTNKSLLEIRNIIDNKYKEGFAKPTPTPLPVD
ncbi:MAG TPA: hypothetical protein DDY49_13890 [Paenibacillaceae bacterium]|nr:hypothetical protein [Paenibacillaceae bacterium]